MAIDNSAEKDLYTVYELDGITYLPHYKEPFHYVSPGYDGEFNIKTYYASELVAAGARPTQQLLLTRARAVETANKPQRAYERARR
jgi:hypothetical protein